MPLAARRLVSEPAADRRSVGGEIDAQDQYQNGVDDRPQDDLDSTESVLRGPGAHRLQIADGPGPIVGHLSFLHAERCQQTRHLGLQGLGALAVGRQVLDQV